MEPSQLSSEQVLRDFISHELPKLTEEFADEIVNEVAKSRELFSRYSKAHKAAGRGFTYLSKRSSCRKIQEKTAELVAELEKSDLILLDELHDFLGNPNFERDIIGLLIKLQNACGAISRTVPTKTKFGRQQDRILYDWVLSMAQIFEDLLKPEKANHLKKGKFTKFLNCWKPDELRIYGALSPRTVKRILEFRQYYKEDLRSTFKPVNIYSPKM